MMRSAIILCAVLILPQLCFGSGVGDICIKLNGGADVVYTDQPNILEIWIENDVALDGASWGLVMHWDPSVSITWNMSYGNKPPLQEHGRAVGAWDLTNGVVSANSFDNLSRDSIGMGGASLVVDFPAGSSELCYSLEFDASAPPGVIVDGFCVEPCFYPPSYTWTFVENGGVTNYQPNFCGYVVIDEYDPTAPPKCFDVENSCDDLNDDGNVNIADLTYLIEYMFDDGPAPIGEADMDECGSVNMADVMYLIAYLFLGGPAPCAGSVACNLPTGGNSIDLGCPINIDTPNGDSVPIPIYITNDTPIRAVSLGFHHNSPDIEIISVSFDATVVPSGLTQGANVDTGNNEVLIYWDGFTTDLSPQSGGLLATMWAQVPVSTPNQTIDIDSIFVGPGGEFIFCPATGGAIPPAYNDCGLADIVITTPQPYVCGDVDCSSAVDIDDVVYLINYIFASGPPPCDPDDNGTPDCGN